jgi:hypothetical protein
VDKTITFSIPGFTGNRQQALNAQLKEFAPEFDFRFSNPGQLFLTNLVQLPGRRGSKVYVVFYKPMPELLVMFLSFLKNG